MYRSFLLRARNLTAKTQILIFLSVLNAIVSFLVGSLSIFPTSLFSPLTLPQHSFSIVSRVSEQK